ncbi:procathepsin L-like [Chiloscyllium plagiosum]|uniref:procathepsin L-like n=1 Tax=Chiloscyllium plagiosum TaxID=36176 RepID=UPI001CB86109|nr:procathepsin L-like [Chiloscyllium plagiosum]
MSMLQVVSHCCRNQIRPPGNNPKDAAWPKHCPRQALSSSVDQRAENSPISSNSLFYKLKSQPASRSPPSSSRKGEQHASISINGNEVERMENVKFPRLTIMDKLSGKYHVFVPLENYATTPLLPQRAQEFWHGQCHSDWAFSATGAIEGQCAKRHGNLVSLSEQNLIDCKKPSNGCFLGTALNGFHQVIDFQGINSEETYPYTGKDTDYCRFQPDKIAAKITDYKWVWGGEAALEQALREIGPMSVVINASLKSFQHYKGGVYYDENCNGYVTDEVLVVGFGTKDEMNYWLVKKSWGTDWGEDGYIKIAKDRGNHCEIASFVRYPVV